MIAVIGEADVGYFHTAQLVFQLTDSTADILHGCDQAEVDDCAVDLGEVTKSLEASGKIVLIDKDGFEVSNPYVKCNVSDVVASYDVNKYKDLPLIVQTKYGYLDSSNLSVDIDPHTIRVRGEPEAVDAVSFLVAAVIDEKLMTETTTNYSVSVKLPDHWISCGKSSANARSIMPPPARLMTNSVISITIFRGMVLIYSFIDFFFCIISPSFLRKKDSQKGDFNSLLFAYPHSVVNIQKDELFCSFCHKDKIPPG